MINLKTLTFIGVLVSPIASYAEPPKLDYNCGENVLLKYDELISAFKKDEDAIIAKMKRGWSAQMTRRARIKEVQDKQGMVTNIAVDELKENSDKYTEASEDIIPNYVQSCRDALVSAGDTDRTVINNKVIAAEGHKSGHNDRIRSFTNNEFHKARFSNWASCEGTTGTLEITPYN